MIWENRSSAGRGRAVFSRPGGVSPNRGWTGWHPGLDSFIRSLVGRVPFGTRGNAAPCWARRGERAGARCRSRGILSELKESPLTIPKKNSGGVSIPPPDPSYDQRRGLRASPLETSPSWTGSGVYGGRWDGGRESRAGYLRRFRAFCLVGDEVGEGLVVLAPTLGG